MNSLTFLFSLIDGSYLSPPYIRTKIAVNIERYVSPSKNVVKVVELVIFFKD